MAEKKNDEGVIEFICEGGSGGEARVDVELRTKFPGIGGTIITQQGALTALREEHNPTPKGGHKMFLRHMVIKKLEDYFHRTKVYNFSHIPRPFGSISKEREKPYEAYLYQWAFGNESFPWEISDHDGNMSQVKLNDWNKFRGNFNLAGIDMARDVTDPHDMRISQNIIYQFSQVNSMSPEISSIWKRIDFGYNSTPIDYDKLSRFLYDNKGDIVRVLRRERYQMLELTIEYLTKGEEKMKEFDIGRLDVLVGDYRNETLRHHTSRGSGIMDSKTYRDERTESLILNLN